MSVSIHISIDTDRHRCFLQLALLFMCLWFPFKAYSMGLQKHDLVRFLFRNVLFFGIREKELGTNS